MNNPSLKMLDWDSNFFKMRVARVLKSAKQFLDLIPIFKELESEKIDLAYFSSKEEISGSEKIIFQDFEMNLVDEKATFLKKLEKQSKNHPNISAYTENIIEPTLFDLAIESGIHSRFKVDERIPNSKFEEMYRLWMINSVNKKISDVVLVYKEADKIIGFVTVGKKENRGNIGIIAVDATGRGKGIGKSLVNAAENYCIEIGLKYLQVVTQGKNIPACKLYEKCGFDLESILYFYHIWKSKN